MKKTLLMALLGCSSVAVFAQMTPVGRWQSVVENTGEPKARILITDSGGVLNARVEKVLQKGAGPDVRCTACTDERKDQPMVGLEIIRGAKKTDGQDVWEGGKVLDPEVGKSYALRLTPIDGGAKLEVRGSVGPFSRTQTWTRVP